MKTLAPTKNQIIGKRNISRCILCLQFHKNELTLYVAHMWKQRHWGTFIASSTKVNTSLQRYYGVSRLLSIVCYAHVTLICRIIFLYLLLFFDIKIELKRQKCESIKTIAATHEWIIDLLALMRPKWDSDDETQSWCSRMVILCLSSMNVHA